MTSKPIPPLTLHRGFPARGSYVPSPFVNKLETRLRIGGVPYKVGAGSVFKAPRGKIPYIDVERAPGATPEQLADSTLITRRLVEEGYIADLNAGLTPAERATDLAVRALLEDKLYFYQVRERWIDNYYVMRDNALSAMPFFIRFFIGMFAYRSVKARLIGQGVLRFTDDEAKDARVEVWESVNALLVDSRNKAHEAGRDGPFWILGGISPTEADATVFGFVGAALDCAQAPTTEQIVRGFPVIMDYARRIHDQYFSDYKLWKE
ncbi:uncharacterized protein B0H64DRAFT_118541 [Chaetomium fimeti]|uniref:Thioredoxin-like fold domain-containing protein n=1 Tax=Chaetomium fimeti TaxID=1854472 RepID=A0AAE0HK67_9PEZI|nr:hypothetical protein B0H64DRAFT_118541 [Chaetomium fimeti]